MLGRLGSMEDDDNGLTMVSTEENLLEMPMGSRAAELMLGSYKVLTSFASGRATSLVVDSDFLNSSNMLENSLNAMEKIILENFIKWRPPWLMIDTPGDANFKCLFFSFQDFVFVQLMSNLFFII